MPTMSLPSFSERSSIMAVASDKFGVFTTSSAWAQAPLQTTRPNAKPTADFAVCQIPSIPCAIMAPKIPSLALLSCIFTNP